MNAPVSLRDLSAARPGGYAAGMRLAFLHIPKTAGTAFGAALSQHFAVEEIAGTRSMALNAGAGDPGLQELARRYRLIGVGSHLDADALTAIGAGLPREERLFTVTVLRNPRARLISQYRHWRRTDDDALAGTPDDYRAAFVSARHLSLRDFLSAGDPFVERHFRDMQARMLAGFGTAELMDDAALLDTARRTLAAIDIAGTVEAIDDLLARIAEAFCWAPPDAIRPLNVAPGTVAPELDAPELDAETEALIAGHTRLDQALWDAVNAGVAAQYPPPRRWHSLYNPDPDLLATLLGGGTTRFRMHQALDGTGWHVREGLNNEARWTGPARRSTIRLRTPPLRALDVGLQMVSVLDWSMVPETRLTLDGVEPLAPPVVDHGIVPPVLRASFALPDDGATQRELAIDVPFTRSHFDVNPAIADARQKGIAFGDITVSLRHPQHPATLGALFWPGEAWSDTAPETLVELLDLSVQDAPPAPDLPGMARDLWVLAALLRLVAPDHVWAAARPSPLAGLERGAPLQGRDGRVVVLATVLDVCSRGAPIAALARRHSHAVLLLSAAEDYRLRALAETPLLAPHLHIIGCTNTMLAVNLTGLRQAGGDALLDACLLLLERIGATRPEKLAVIGDSFGTAYPLRQLDAVLTEMTDFAAGRPAASGGFATLALDETVASGAALRDRFAALRAAPPVALVDPPLLDRLAQALEQLAGAPVPPLGALLSAHHTAFLITGMLGGWQGFGLVGNATAELALRLRPGSAAPTLYPHALKPFREYIDFYRADARILHGQPQAPEMITALDKLTGGLDHVTRLNQAAREIEVALRLLGDRFPGEEILWVDAGCSYGVLVNAVRPPRNVANRCAFLGFDFNAPAIGIARLVAGNLGNAHCRFEVGDVAQAGAIAGRRIHLITAFEVLEHCPDPVAVLRDYRAMDPGMLVVGSPLSEPQSLLPSEQHLWAFDAPGFAAMAEQAGFAVIGVNQRHVGRFVGGNDWVTVTATTGDPATMHMV